MPSRVSGKVALIGGGASGIGAALTTMLAEEIIVAPGVVEGVLVSGTALACVVAAVCKAAAQAVA